MTTHTDQVGENSIRIVRSESFEAKQALIRKAVLKWKGNYESVLELGGKTVGSDIIVTDCLIPKALIGHASFLVKDRDVSSCWSAAENSPVTGHLRPVGDLHYHPESGGTTPPRASLVDERNSLSQASLYFPFNLQISEREQVLTPGDNGRREGYQRYDIDSFRTIFLPCQQSGKGEIELIFKEKRISALWGSLIYTSDAREDLVGAYVTEHQLPPEAEEEFTILRHENVHTVILSDEEVAELAGWPLEKIKLDIDREQLEREVISKYQVIHYGWHGSQTGTPSWGYYDRGYGQDSPSTWGGHNNRYPVICHADAGSDKEEFFYLSAQSRPRDVARVLREALVILDGSSEGDMDFSYLHDKATPGQIILALEESIRLLKGFRNSSKV